MPKRKRSEIELEDAAIAWLYKICRKREACSLDESMALVQQFPNAIHVKDSHGELLLHNACETDCTDEFIQFLVNFWPESCQIPNRYGSMPLHLTIERDAEAWLSLETIQVLVQAWPDAVHVHDNMGWLPLHYACQNKCTDEVIAFLINCWPESVRVPGGSNEGELPLHWACQTRRLSLLVIRSLIEAWPDSVCEQDYHGYLPLHYACEYGCTDDEIRFLVECWPMSVCIKTKGGNLPLNSGLFAGVDHGSDDYHCKPRLSFQTIQFLIQAWPEAIHEITPMATHHCITLAWMVLRVM